MDALVSVSYSTTTWQEKPLIETFSSLGSSKV